MYKNKIPQKIEHCINQNNAVNIYQTYFEDLEPAPLVDRSSSRTMFVYKDVQIQTVIFLDLPNVLINSINYII